MDPKSPEVRLVTEAKLDSSLKENNESLVASLESKIKDATKAVFTEDVLPILTGIRDALAAIPAHAPLPATPAQQARSAQVEHQVSAPAHTQRIALSTAPSTQPQNAAAATNLIATQDSDYYWLDDNGITDSQAVAALEHIDVVVMPPAAGRQADDNMDEGSGDEGIDLEEVEPDNHSEDSDEECDDERAKAIALLEQGAPGKRLFPRL